MNYSKKVRNLIKEIDEEEIKRIAGILFNTPAKIFVIGNGGSMSIAEHFATDLFKVYGKEANSLSNTATITAIANDLSYDDIFYHQLCLLHAQDNVIVVFSTSGKSGNIIKVVDNFIDKATIIGFIGNNGGSLYDDSIDFGQIFKEKDPRVLEDAFSVICHWIITEMEKEDL